MTATAHTADDILAGLGDDELNALYWRLRAWHARRYKSRDVCWGCGQDWCLLWREDDALLCQACIAEKVGGYVYLATDGEPREAVRVKIGHSQDPYFRIDALRREFGVQVDLWLTIPGSRADERRLHDLLAEHRLEREWFSWPPVRQWSDCISPKLRCLADVLPEVV